MFETLRRGPCLLWCTSGLWEWRGPGRQTFIFEDVSKSKWAESFSSWSMSPPCSSISLAVWAFALTAHSRCVLNPKVALKFWRCSKLISGVWLCRKTRIRQKHIPWCIAVRICALASREFYDASIAHTVKHSSSEGWCTQGTSRGYIFNLASILASMTKSTLGHFLVAFLAALKLEIA